MNNRSIRFAASVFSLTTLAIASACVGDDPGTQPNAITSPDGSAPTSDTDSGGASSSGDSGGGGSDAPLATGSVKGRAIDFLGGPIKQATVYIDPAAPFKTADDGTFTIDNAPATYDLTVVSLDAQFGTAVIVAQGVTRRDPTLVVERTLAIDTGGVSGTVAIAGGNHALVLVSGANNIQPTPIVTDTGKYDKSVAFSKTAAGASVLVYALEYSVADGGSDESPTAFVSYGQSDPFSLTAGTQVTNKNVGTAPVSSNDPYSVSISPGAADLTILSKVVRIQVGPSAGITIPIVRDTLAFDFVSPKIVSVPSVHPEVVISAQNSLGHVVTVTERKPTVGSTTTISLPPPTSIVSKPIASEAFGMNSAFEWAATTGAVYEATLFPSDTSSPTPQITILTTKTAVVIPQIPNVTLPANADYSVSVAAFAPLAKIDDFLVVGGQNLAAVQSSTGTVQVKSK